MPFFQQKFTVRFFFQSTLLSILVFVVFSACRSPNQPGGTTVTPEDNPQLPARGFFMGVLPSAASGQSFADAYKTAALFADFAPVWGKPSPFYQLAEDLNSAWGQTFVQSYIRGNGMFPLVHLSFMGAGLTLILPPGMAETTLKDDGWRQAYKQAALDVVRAARPRYISIGNEVNRWYEKYGSDHANDNSFSHFVSLYTELYDAIKELSPETRVFCTFAREIVSENREADLEVLKLFPADRLDLLIFTSYPYAVRGINKPGDVPDDYYARAAAYFPGKPFGFSELGWSSLPAFGGEQGQADFLRDAANRLTRDQGISLHLFGWAWLHDLDANDTIGLIQYDGTPKLAFEVWKTLFNSSNSNTRLSEVF